MVLRRSRRHDRVAAWTAALALLFQALLPLGQALPSPRAVAAGSGAPLALLICTAWGLKPLAPPDGAAKAPASGAHPSCPICLAFALGGSLLPPAMAALPAPAMAGPKPPATTAAHIAVATDCPPPLPRGPPLLA